ncbi:MAG TPA: DNA methylase, partial [Anaerolineae bacterium]|nr:DNA methylase [Anaerolineae bacterium]
MKTHPIDAQFDETFADELARLETYNKHLYRPNTYLHKWWARRCGSTFRLILKSLADDPAMRDYYAPGGLAGKIILDPMMGGGTTLHEAIRLGANVIGADIDPIPILQARASLTERPLEQLTAAFNELYRALRARLAPFFRTSCPVCQEETE